jgi:hypothetical protein
VSWLSDLTDIKVEHVKLAIIFLLSVFFVFVAIIGVHDNSAVAHFICLFLQPGLLGLDLQQLFVFEGQSLGL